MGHCTLATLVWDKKNNYYKPIFVTNALLMFCFNYRRTEQAKKEKERER